MPPELSLTLRQDQVNLVQRGAFRAVGVNAPFFIHQISNFRFFLGCTDLQELQLQPLVAQSATLVDASP